MKRKAGGNKRGADQGGGRSIGKGAGKIWEAVDWNGIGVIKAVKLL